MGVARVHVRVLNVHRLCRQVKKSKSEDVRVVEPRRASHRCALWRGNCTEPLRHMIAIRVSKLTDAWVRECNL